MSRPGDAARRRVTLVTTSYPRTPTDAEGHFVRAEALILAETREVHVVAPRARRELDDPITVHGVAAGDAFGPPGLASRLEENPSRSFGAALFFARVSGAVRASHADELVIHWPFPVALALAHPRTTLVSHGACVRAILALPSALRTGVVLRLLRGETRWRFVSDALLTDLASALPPRARAVLDARAFVEAAHVVFPPRDALGPPWPRPALVVIGRLVRTKRVDEALRYVARTDSLRGHDVVLIGDGPERRSLEALGASLGLSLHAIGARPRPAALGLLAGSDALLFASKTEGASTVLREAAHYGVRVIAVP